MTEEIKSLGDVLLLREVDSERKNKCYFYAKFNFGDTVLVRINGVRYIGTIYNVTFYKDGTIQYGVEDNKGNKQFLAPENYLESLQP